MKKKITILMAFAAMFAGSGGVAYGQMVSDPQRYVQLRAYGDIVGGLQGTTSGALCGGSPAVEPIESKFTVENNYGPGETGTLTPDPATVATGSKNTGRWTGGSPSATFAQGFNMGSGRITLGGTTNHVLHQATGGNYNSNFGGIGTSVTVTATGAYKTTSDCDGGNSTQEGSYTTYPGATVTTSGNNVSQSYTWGPATVQGVTAPDVPDGSGKREANSHTYTKDTEITVDGTSASLSSENPWWLQQFYFLNNPWYYYETTFTYPSESHTVSFTTTRPAYTCTGSLSTTPSWSGNWTDTPSETDSHNRVDWATTSHTDAVRPATLFLLAGSNVRLEGTDAPAVSIAASSLGSTVAKLDLPTTYYSLMNDRLFNASATNFTVTNIAPLGLYSIMGVQTGFVASTTNPYLVVNAAGGTLLIGGNIAGQDVMGLPTTTGNVPAGGFLTKQVYTNTDIGVNGTVNLGNYGDNDVNIDYSSTLFGNGQTNPTSPINNNVGTSAMQIYNHHTLPCRNINFRYLNATVSPLTININDAGYFIIDGYNQVNFNTNVPQTFTATSTGRTVINGGEVNINAAHKFTGSDTPTNVNEAYYSINAYNTNPGRVRTHFGPWGTNSSFWNGTFQTCGTGTINLNSVTADVSESANGNLLWNANTDIMGNNAGSIIHFTMTGANGSMRWFAGRNIKTDDGVYFSNTGNAVGHTEWNAVWNITDNDTVKFVHSNTSSLTNYLEVKADSGNITANNWYDVEMSNPSRASILAENTTGANSLYFPSTTSHRIVVPYVLGPALNSNLYPSAYPQYGNIFFRDSLKLQRLATTGNASMTEIVAGNNIITAMVNYKSNNATNGDNTNIISHMGDIFLGYNITPTGTGSPASNPPVSYDNNRFVYNIPNAVPNGLLYIHAGSRDSVNLGWTGAEDAAAVQTNGGNIYFTHFCDTLADGSNYNTEVSIAGTNWYRCGSPWSSTLLHNRAGAGMWNYENSGIIGGVARCAMDSSPVVCDTLGLLYSGSNGNLKFDAGTRGNIIINNGAKVTFKDGTGNAIFRTRNGDIDMRYPFDVDSMQGGMLFLAQVNNLGDLQNPNYMSYCGCNEETNNVYLQDFQYIAGENSGSVYVGADNNIKLNYGGLQNVGTKYDPFLSKDYLTDSEGNPLKVGTGYPCGNDRHCDSHDSVNLARTLLLNFYKDTTSAHNLITSGGFAAVASDYIDVYKDMIYLGGNGSGLQPAPETGTLHGESVAGYGLYMKTQGNKSNWDVNPFRNIPKCPMSCFDDCSSGVLHMVSRLTFHSDARINAHNQKVYLGSPTVEVYGNFVLNSDSLKGGKTNILVQADSLIMHDSLILIGKKYQLKSWSGLSRDVPVMKFGHNRYKPPFTEWNSQYPLEVVCEPCHDYIRFSDDPLHMLDTIVIKFQDDAFLERMNSAVFDHTILTFLTDSFDHKLGNPVQNAKIYVDTLKFRNQVDLYAAPDHTRDAHLELISEEQMHSKDYAGAYTLNAHMEPIGACEKNYSELWTSDDLALDVITTSTFGGFGFIHSDVHVENDANLNAGFTSLRLHGQCYEQRCGTQQMKDLRLDKGANLHFSVGSTPGIKINSERGLAAEPAVKLSDAIIVDNLTTYGTINVHVEKRPCEHFNEGCYPIIYYNSQTAESINNLKLVVDIPDKNSDEYKNYREDYDALQKAVLAVEDGVVYICSGEDVFPSMSRSITIPSVEGVTTNPPAGISYVASQGNFKFTAKYSTEKPLKVMTNRVLDGVQEELKGTKNANGEYEYTIRQVAQNIVLSIGPDFVANASVDGTAVWSHNEMIYIKVEREDIASIYSIAGQLVKRIDLPEGDTSIPMERGVYVVTLKDGSVHKVIVK